VLGPVNAGCWQRIVQYAPGAKFSQSETLYLQLSSPVYTSGAQRTVGLITTGMQKEVVVVVALVVVVTSRHSLA
jgi:hypothetical protein